MYPCKSFQFANQPLIDILLELMEFKFLMAKLYIPSMKTFARKCYKVTSNFDSFSIVKVHEGIYLKLQDDLFKLFSTD